MKRKTCIVCKFVLNWLMLAESVNAAIVWNSPRDRQSVHKDEDTAVDSVIMELDATTATSYTIESQMPESPKVFNISLKNVILISHLDYETHNKYTLTLVAHSADSTAKVTMEVIVGDVNEAPEFTTTALTINVESGVSRGKYIYDVSENVTDPEGNTLTYSITEEPFAINEETGVITTEQNIEFNSESPSISATVTATDGKSTAELDITVYIKTRPELVLPNLNKVEVEETVEKGFIVYELSAQDDDGDTDFTFSIGSQSNADAFVLNEKSSALVTNTKFDFESGNTSFIVMLKVSDSFPLVSTSELKVSIVDVNDELPEFSSESYTASVKENVESVTSITQVQATDADANDKIAYSFDGENDISVFTIDESTGVVGTQGSIDFETTPSITLKVVATDRADNKGLARLIVTVIEESDPYFVNPSPEGSSIDLNESTEEDTVVYELSANDTDGDELTFRFTNDNDEFDLQTNEVLLASTLDYENQISYILTFEVTDKNKATATASLTINIIDVNDNSPIFIDTPYEGVVVEKMTSPIKVITVNTTDADSSLGDHNVVKYSITDGDTTNSFDIDGATGVITATNLKYADSNMYMLEVTAKDLNGAEGANEAKVTVNVEVKSVPYWENLAEPAIASKPENVDQSEVFFTLSATDPDGDTLTYSIKSQTVDNLFTVGGVNKRDVVLNGKNTLDYEDTKKHNLTFEVTDGYSDPVISSILEIQVTDVNDNAPVFASNNINMVVRNTRSVGDVIKTITATDADSSVDGNNVITYKFKSGNGDDHFAISTSGTIKLEKVVSVGDAFTLVVLAEDGGTPTMSGSVTLYVTSSVATDPVLKDLLETKTVPIDEDVGLGTEVYKIESSDADGDTLLYTIEQQTSDKFELRDNVLVVSKSLDSERENTYKLKFGIDDDDGNTGNKLTSGTLVINVNDINDNFPTFSKESYTVNVVESQLKEMILIKLNATDADVNKTSNGALEYNIVDGDLFDQFKVDRLNGQLSTKAVLHESKQKYHVLAIQAIDKGTPPRADSVHVIINVNVKHIGDKNKNLSSKPNPCDVLLFLSLVLLFC